MATSLRNITVKEISLVKKGANGKRIHLTKSQETEMNENAQTQEIEKAQAEATAAKVALEKAEADRKAAEDKIVALEKAQAEASEKAAAEKALLEKAQAEAVEKAADLEKALAVEKEAKEVSESVQKAAVAFKHLPETPENLGPMLRSIRKVDAAVADKLEALLTKVDALSKSALDPRGTSVAGDASATALDEIQKRAKALVDTGKAATLAKAFDAVLCADKDLYTRYQAEKAAK